MEAILISQPVDSVVSKFYDVVKILWITWISLFICFKRFKGMSIHYNKLKRNILSLKLFFYIQ